MKATALLASLVVAFLLAFPASSAARGPHRWLSSVPARFVADALCVHDGWHHAARPPNYPRTYRVGSGEAPWHYRGAFRGGLQWTYGTWYAAGGHGDPADASPGEEIYRAYVHVVLRGGGWEAWPNTARACGLL